MAEARKEKNATTADIGFEAKLWLAADKLCNNLIAACHSSQVPCSIAA